jgi:hypothetical protein
VRVEEWGKNKKVIFTFTVTIVIEGVIAFIYSRWREKPLPPILLTSLFANLITQSILWIALLLFFRHYWGVLIVMEIFIWLLESLIFYRVRANQLTLKEATLLSLAINLTSFSLGLFLN